VTVPRWRLTKPLRARIREGHPWVYDRALAPVPAQLAAGDVALLVDDEGPLALAFADPASPIRARLLDVPEAVIDRGWKRARAQAAAARRARDPLLVGCTGRRIVHGEGDHCPGLVIDVYADTAVVVFDGEASAAFWRPALAEVIDGIVAGGIAIAHVWVRAVRGVKQEGSAFRGNPPAEIAIAEDEAQFLVDVRHGQKTGFFLDQRENRRTIRKHAAGASVLNLFSYSGGFSLHASLGGATHVTSVDIAPQAIATLHRNVERSGLPKDAHEGVVADVFDFLARARKQGRSWDLVIVDPPSFAPNERAKPNALAAYRKLAVVATEVVSAGGRFALASCSSHVTEPELLAMMATVRPDARLRLVAGAGSDHPVLPGFAEGRYLKFLFFDV
jgi:23S rRNA (cytosine1962-C5)-methyltransferase